MLHRRGRSGSRSITVVGSSTGQRHPQREETCGRAPATDWGWIDRGKPCSNPHKTWVHDVVNTLTHRSRMKRSDHEANKWHTPMDKSQTTSRRASAPWCTTIRFNMEFKMYTLRYQYISPLQSERDRIHCPSWDKLHSNLFTNTCLLWTSSCCTSSIKCLKPFYECFELNRVLQSVTYPIFILNKMF